jgi:hypothetical protein
MIKQPTKTFNRNLTNIAILVQYKLHYFVYEFTVAEVRQIRL